MGIGNNGFCTVRYIAVQLIILRNILLKPGVLDFLAVLIDRQVLHLRSPFVSSLQHHILLVLTIRLKGDRQFIRTLAVLVVRVVPDLLHGHFGLFRLMTVYNHKAFAGITGNGHGILSVVLHVDYAGRCRTDFLHGIADLKTFVVSRQTGPCNRALRCRHGVRGDIPKRIDVGGNRNR